MLSRRDRGSVLLLVPAGVLVVVVLGSIAVDFGIAFLGEREVASLASAAANDAVTAGVDEDHLRETGEFRLDPDRVEAVVAATIAASSTEVDLDAPVVQITVVDGEPAVRVELTGRIDYVFAPALPGGPEGTEVSASAVAIASEGRPPRRTCIYEAPSWGRSRCRIAGRLRDDRAIEPDRTLPFVFVDDLDAPVLVPEDRHHLERVRRLRDGDGLTVGDGRGSFRAARFGTDLRVDGPVHHVTPAAPAVAVGFALTKGDRPELVVQKLTELGVDRVVPFVAARTVVRWDDDKAARNVERWRVIAREAAAQAHRPWLPLVEPVRPFVEVAGHPALSLAEPGGHAPSLRHPVVLVGPEGGWAPEELAAVAHRTALPGHILRAETAAVVAGALLVALRGGIRAPSGGSAET